MERYWSHLAMSNLIFSEMFSDRGYSRMNIKNLPIYESRAPPLSLKNKKYLVCPLSSFPRKQPTMLSNNSRVSPSSLKNKKYLVCPLSSVTGKQPIMSSNNSQVPSITNNRKFKKYLHCFILSERS